MKLHRSPGLWAIAICRLCLCIIWSPNVAIALSLAPKERPWWSLRDGYVWTKVGAR
jgi:hypothetical protein